MSEFSNEEIDYILRNVRYELQHMDASKKKAVTTSQQSFGQWLSRTVGNIARTLGYIISVPFRLIGELLSALFR